MTDQNAEAVTTAPTRSLGWRVLTPAIALACWMTFLAWLAFA